MCDKGEEGEVVAMVEEERCEVPLEDTEENSLSLDAVQLHDPELDGSVEPMISTSASSTSTVLILQHTNKGSNRKITRQEAIALSLRGIIYLSCVPRSAIS